MERKSPEEEEGAAAAKVGDGALRPPLFFLTLLGMLAPAQKFINMSVFLGNSSTRAQYPRSVMPRERPHCKKLRKFVEFRSIIGGWLRQVAVHQILFKKWNGAGVLQYLDISGKFLEQSAMNLSSDANR